MQFNKSCLFVPLLLIASTCFGAAAEEQMDVDLSDSLNYEAFHKNKEAAVKVWDDKQPEKAYEQKPAAGNTTAATGAPTAEDKTGKRYEIRELYSISGSNRTGYTPTTVVQALYLQMQGLCPDGWKKLDERSEPDGKDAFYMYYSFECL